MFFSFFAVTQGLIGSLDIKKKSVHFYVTRQNNVGPSDAIPWEVEHLNEGGAMDLPSGVFTVPVNGIYHFDFSGLKRVSLLVDLANTSPISPAGLWRRICCRFS